MRALIEPGFAESRRFGVKLGRAVSGSALDAKALREEIVAGAWDLVVLRLPCGAEKLADELRRLGLEPMQTDTLVTFSGTLEPWRDRPLSLQGITLRSASEQDAQSIGRLVEASFGRYPNHYNANPFLDPAAALEGYVEWALAHIAHPERECWIACVDGHAAGLACSRHDPSSSVATGVLHGVDPAFAGRGIYRSMIEASLVHYAARGLRSFQIATQAGNLTVQRMWARLGLILERSDLTFHLMPLLGLAEGGTAVAVDGNQQNDYQEVLWRTMRAHSPGAAERIVLACPDQASAHTGAMVMRSATRQGRNGLRRGVSALYSAAGDVLAWGHCDLRQPAVAAGSSPHSPE